MQTSAYFAQAEKNIHALINEKKYKEAYLKCKKYLQKFPDEGGFEKLMVKIEKLIIKENEKVIDRKIDETNKLWKKEEYRHILEILEPLLKLNRDNDKLKKKIVEAQEAYKEQVQKEAKEFENDQRKKFNKLFKKDEAELEEELFALERNNPGNDLAKRIAFEYRDKIIEKKINEKSDLIFSDKYDSITNLIIQLKRIDKKNPRILEIETAIKKRKAGTQMSEKGEYVYRGEKHLDTLMRLGKYDKASQVAREILEVDRGNKKVRSILINAEKKLFKQTQAAAVIAIKANYKKLKEAYKKDKTKFVKI